MTTSLVRSPRSVVNAPSVGVESMVSTRKLSTSVTSWTFKFSAFKFLVFSSRRRPHADALLSMEPARLEFFVQPIECTAEALKREGERRALRSGEDYLSLLSITFDSDLL